MSARMDIETGAPLTSVDRHLRVDAALVGVTLSWALSFVVTKFVLTDIHPSTMTLGVLIVISSLSFLWLRAAEGSVAVRRQDLPWLAVSGLTGYALFRITTNLGLNYSSVFSSTVLLATTPLWANLFALTSGAERVSGRQWLGQALTLAGIAVFAGRGMLRALLGGGGPGLGDILFTGSAASWAAYGVINRRLLRRYSALRLTSWSTLTPVHVVRLAGRGLDRRPPRDMVGPGLQRSGADAARSPRLELGDRPARVGVTYMNLVPIFGGALAWATLGETPSPGQFLGAGLVFVGLSLARRV